MKAKESQTSSLVNPESVVSRFCTAFLEAGWIAAAVLSALFMNLYNHRIFDLNKAILIRSIAILMFVAWLIKTIEHHVLIRTKFSRPLEQPQETRSKYGWLKYSILLPAGLYFFSYFISSLTSVLPTTSFWGSYARVQGLYTFTAYFVIFILAATHIRTRAQIERLITAIILASLLVMVYGLIQKLGWDPVPWGVGLTRISSTMGNPIFLAAYLIMIVPLVLARLLQHIKRIKQRNLLNQLTVTFYSFVLLLQIVSIILTQSRGPLLGLVSGVAFFFFIYAIIYKKKVLVWGLVSGFILASVFVVIFNLPNTPLKALKKVPYLERLGNFSPSEGSARVRIVFWGNALKLMRETYQPILPHPELVDAYPWRFLLGYGPETLGNIFYRHHTAELVAYEGRILRVDHCHNSLLQAFVTQGVFGLIAFLCLISGAIYLGLKTLKRLKVARYSKQIKRINQINPFTAEILVLGIISAIVADVVETLFGIGIVVTSIHFWLFLALLHAIDRFSRMPDESLAAREPRQAIGTEGVSRRDGRGQFLTTLLFWAYLGVSLVIIVVVIKYYWSSLETNVKAGIMEIYLWVLLGILLGAISLLRPVSGRSQGHPVSVSQSASKHITPHASQRTLVSVVFNIVRYIGLIVVAFSLILVAFSLIVYSNFNPILADGYYKISLLAKDRAEKIHKSYRQHDGVRRRLLQKKRRVGLSPDEEKQLQSITKQRLKMLSDMFGLHLDSMAYDQRALRLAPNEKTYLHGMGQNFLELANIWRAIKDSGWTIRATPKDSGAMDINVPRHLSEPPGIKEIMDFSADQYGRFNEYDFFYCCLTIIHRAYEIEPTNYKRRLAMAKIHHYAAKVTRRDGKIQKSKEYFKKAMRYGQEAKDASPNHPVVNEYLKVLQKEMGKR